MKLTYLMPTASWASTAKTFSAPGVKTSDYNLGKFFEFDLAEYATLQDLADDMRARSNAFAIYGAPSDTINLVGGEVQRLTTNFPYGDDHDLHILDIDGWIVPDIIQEQTKARITDPTSMGRLVNAMLDHEGFPLLARASKVVTLSSSCWTVNHLNCHVYVQFSGPVRIEAMREFALALSKLRGKKVFDDAVYKAVQPQFFSAPRCEGFQDPIDHRIFYVQGQYEQIPLQDFQSFIAATLRKADWDPNKSNTQLPAIGIDWLDTIQNHVNDVNGINQPCYRAASQLLQQVGRQQVLSNISQYAEEMYEAAWEAISNNCNERGLSQKDRQTYNLERFRQYLDSATQKNFGDHVDRYQAQIREAIEAGKSGDLTKITSVPVARALATLKSKHPGNFILLKKEITASKVLAAGDITELVKSGSRDVTTTENGELILGDATDENMLIETAIKQYEYIQDPSGNKYAAVPGNGDGGYKMMRVDGSLIDVFYADGMTLSGNAVSPQFGKKVLSMLMGREAKAISSMFRQEDIGYRVVTEGGGVASPIWINAGKQPDGMYKSIRITPDDVQVVSHKDSAVMWSFGTPPLYFATNEQIKERFGDDADLTGYLVKNLPYFIGVQEDSVDNLLMWLCAAMADKTLSYIAEFTGPPGFGKSTAAEFMKDLVDPSREVFKPEIDRTMFRGATDNFVADIERRYVTIIDNISHLQPADQDYLCMVATGLRHSERILYTQTQMERTVKRPLILTCLSAVITRPDLRSRVISIDAADSAYNKDIMSEWVAEKPYFVAALLQLTRKTMKLFTTTSVIPEGVSKRDVFRACVHSAIRGKDEADFSTILLERQAEAEATREDVGFIAILEAFLKDRYPGDEIVLHTRGLRDRMHKWCAKNSGKEVGGVTIAARHIPETGAGLGWMLSKHFTVICETSNLEFIKKERGKNGTTYIFHRKPIDLEDLI